MVVTHKQAEKSEVTVRTSDFSARFWFTTSFCFLVSSASWFSKASLPSLSAFVSAPSAVRNNSSAGAVCPCAVLCSCCRRAEPGTKPGWWGFICNAALLSACCLLESPHGHSVPHALRWTLLETTGPGHCCLVSLHCATLSFRSSLNRQRAQISTQDQSAPGLDKTGCDPHPACFSIRCGGCAPAVEQLYVFCLPGTAERQRLES